MTTPSTTTVSHDPLMRALLYTEDRTLDVVDVPAQEVGAGDVAVRVAAAGICGSDIHGVGVAQPAPDAAADHGARAGGRGGGRRRRRARVAGRPRVAVNPQVPCGLCGPCRSGARERLPEPRDDRRNAPGRLRRAADGAAALRAPAAGGRRPDARPCSPSRWPPACTLPRWPAARTQLRGRLRRRDDRRADGADAPPDRHRLDRGQRHRRRAPRPRRLDRRRRVRPG